MKILHDNPKIIIIAIMCAVLLVALAADAVSQTMTLDQDAAFQAIAEPIGEFFTHPSN